MATTIFRGDAPIVQEVYTLVVGGTIETDDIFNVTINTKTLATNAGSTVAATVATTIQTALAASTIDEFEEVTWTVNSATITGTGPDDGTPVTITGSTTEAGGGAADAQTFVITNTVEAEGPNDWNVIENWSNGAVPGADTVWLKDSDIDIKYGLAQSGVTLTALNSEASFTGDLGLPAYSEAGDYYEYRALYLAISVTTWNHGRGDGDGSPRFQLNTGTNACTAHIWRTGARVDTGVPPCLWKGVHASNVMTVHRGDVGIAFLPGDVATLPTLNVGYLDNQDGDATVTIGSGTTLTTVTQTGGAVTNFATATVTTYSIQGGTYKAYGGTHLTMTIDGGTVIWMGTGQINTLTINTDGIFDADQSDGNFVVAGSIVMRAGSTLRNRKNRINNGAPLTITLSGCTLKDVDLQIPDNIDVQINVVGDWGFATNGQMVAGFVPLDMQTARSGDYVNMNQYGHCTLIFFKGTGTDGDDPIITLQQASDNGGTGVKALNFSALADEAVYTKQGADVLAVAQFTRITPITGGIHTFTANTYVNTDGHLQAIWLIEIDRAALDIAGGFTYLRATFNDTGTNAQLGCLLYGLSKPLDSTLPSAL